MGDPQNGPSTTGGAAVLETEPGLGPEPQEGGNRQGNGPTGPSGRSPTRRPCRVTLIRLGAGWGVGLLAAHQVGFPPSACALILFAASSLLIVHRASECARLCLLVVACSAAGALRVSLASQPLDSSHIALLNGVGPMLFRGTVSAEPDRRDRRIGYRVAASEVLTGGSWRSTHGTVLMWLPRDPVLHYGDKVEIAGALAEPEVLEGFDYRAYLARRGIHSVVQRPRVEAVSSGGGHPLRRLLLTVKDRARQVIASTLPEPEASLATGILLGDARRMPERVDEAFRVTNTTHVIAISGANVSLLVMGLTMAFGQVIGRRRALVPVLTILGLYTALVGADAAVVRAAIMGGVAVVGSHSGRPGHAPTALAAAAWAMTAYRPSYVWDLGFQLSFAATLGLVWFTEPIAEVFERFASRLLDPGRAKALVRLTYEAVVVTAAAQLTTWPLIAHQVGQVSLAGLLANLLVLPAQPPLMVLGAAATLVGMMNLTLGKIVAAAAWLPLAYTIRTVELAARLPLASVAWQMPTGLLFAYYAGLAALQSPRGSRSHFIARVQAVVRHGVRATSVVRLDRELHSSSAKAPAAPTNRSRAALAAALRLRAQCSRIAFLVLALGTAIVWIAALSRPDGLLHVYQLDVGQGDAILVVTPNGMRMLVDGGPSPSAVLDGLGRRFPPWDRRLDVVVLTHPDSDHVGGLSAVLDRYDVAFIVDPMLESGSTDSALWESAVEREGAVVVRASEGATVLLDRDAGVSARVLWPPEARPAGTVDLNDLSAVLRLEYGARSVLLTGDIGADTEGKLVRSGAPLDTDVLKVSHHGSGGSSCEAFIAAVSPDVALIGVGTDNSFGHPSPDVLARLASVPIGRTDRDGQVEVLSDGSSIWLRR